MGMRWRVLLLASLLLVATACGPGDLEVVVTVPEAVPEQATDAVAKVVALRLADLAGESWQVSISNDGLVIRLPEGTDPAIVDLVIAQGCVEMRPVLDVMTEVPHTATAAVDLIYVVDSLGLVYHTGPAFIEGEFADGTVDSIEGPGGAATWVVEPTLSARGKRAFVEATKTLATYPAADPRRQIAIVVDRSVISAPQVALDVDPSEGLDPEAIVITLGDGPLMEERARAFATYLRYGCLPVPLEVSAAAGS